MSLLAVIMLSAMLTQQITWTTKTPIPQLRAGSGCAVVSDTIYVIGGRDSAGNRYSTNYVYDPVNDSWSTRADMPTARAHISCAVVNGKIYAFGGWVGSTATGVVEEYDPAMDIWRTMTPMPTPRYCLGCAVFQDRIYIIGGMNMQGQIFNTLEEYDPSADTVGGAPWGTKAQMTVARMGPGAAIINDTMFVYGGCIAIGTQVTTVNEGYDLMLDTWFTRTPLYNGRYAHGYFAYDNKAYAVGGYSLSVYYNSVEVFDPSTNAWSYETSMQYERQSVAVGLVGNKVYVIGGWNNGALAYNEEGRFPLGIEEEDHVNSKFRNWAVKISPNPFATSTTIYLSGLGQRAERIELQIFDMAGRRVGEFILYPSSSILAAKVKWDGSDISGRLLPSGKYILRVKGDGINETRIINLIR